MANRPHFPLVWHDKWRRSRPRPCHAPHRNILSYILAICLSQYIFFIVNQQKKILKIESFLPFWKSWDFLIPISQRKLVVYIKKWVDVNEYKYVCIKLVHVGKIDNMHWQCRFPSGTLHCGNVFIFCHFVSIRVIFCQCMSFCVNSCNWRDLPFETRLDTNNVLQYQVFWAAFRQLKENVS